VLSRYFYRVFLVAEDMGVWVARRVDKHEGQEELPVEKINLWKISAEIV
jgi:hypothetical protein